MRVGFPWNPFRDLYFEVQRGSWRMLGLLYVGGFLLANIIFAGLYMLGGDCIEGAEPGSFRDLFFFSVQTLATIGYGELAPKTLYAHLVVMVEAMVGLLGVAIGTGLAFAKFSRPSAMVRFSKNILLAPHDGQPSIYFRTANVRGNDIVEATIHVSALRTHISSEGHVLRRVHDLKLTRTTTPLFRLSWLVIHQIDRDSPLYGLSLQDLIDDRVLFIVSMIGLDSTFGQSIHSRHIYVPGDIVEGHHFADVIRDLDDGRIEFDFSQFDRLVPLPKPVAAEPPGGTERDRFERLEIDADLEAQALLAEDEQAAATRSTDHST